MNKDLFRITKTKLLDEGFNDKAGHYWSYVYYFRIYNEDRKRYYRYAFIIGFTGEDLAEFSYDEEDDVYYNYEPKEYADELASSFIYAYEFSYKNHDEFFAACKESIERYNRRFAIDYDSSTIWGMACELTREVFGDIADNRVRI